MNIESRIGTVGAGLAFLGGGLVIARGVGAGARIFGALSAVSLGFAGAADALYWHVPQPLGRMLAPLGFGCLAAAVLLLAIRLYVEKGGSGSPSLTCAFSRAS